jgi:hypothetical protein
MCVLGARAARVTALPRRARLWPRGIHALRAVATRRVLHHTPRLPERCTWLLVLRLCTCCRAAVVKRVLLVLLAGVALGTALFFIGLEYAFPKY